MTVASQPPLWRRALARLDAIGSHHPLPVRDRRRRVVINRVFGVLSFFLVLRTIGVAMLGHELLMVMALSFLFSTGVVLLCVHTGRFPWAKLFCAFGPAVLITFWMLYLFGEDLFTAWPAVLGFSFLAFTLFDSAERRWAIASVVIALACVAALVILPSVVPMRAHFSLPEQWLRLLRLVAPLTQSCFIMAVAGLVYMDSVQAKDRADALLLNILPEPIAERLQDGEAPIADRLEEVSVLFVDIVGFTQLSARLDPRELVAVLDAIFRSFDDVTDSFGLEKIKTIGDAYMAAAGVPQPDPDHARNGRRMHEDTSAFLAWLS